MRKPRSLILAPFDAEGARVQEALRYALEKLDIEVAKFDDLVQRASLTNATLDAIKSADFVIADITNQNANVLYELGVVHALRKPSVLIASANSEAGIPPTLEGFYVVVYDPADLRDLANRVASRAERLVSEAIEKYA